MALKDLMALYGRVGLIVVAFSFVAAIVMAPLLQKAMFSNSAVAERDVGSVLQVPKISVDTMPRRQS